MSKLVPIQDRVFKVIVEGEEKSFKIIKPTFSQGNKADLIYKRAFAEALREGLLTSVQMSDFVSESEYFKKSNDSLAKIDIEIAENIAKLSDFQTEEEATPVIIKIQELRARRMLENYRLNSVYEHTAENYAENLRNQFYASELLRDSEGNRPFKNFDDFKNKMADALAQEAIANVMLFMARVSDNYRMELPENQWMLSKGIINERGEYTGSTTKETVKSDENKGINIEEESSSEVSEQG